jgi:hypothetical protein
MTDPKHIEQRSLKGKALCAAQKPLEQLVEYLADLAAEEHLKQASEKRRP